MERTGRQTLDLKGSVRMLASSCAFEAREGNTICVSAWTRVGIHADPSPQKDAIAEALSRTSASPFSR